MGGLLALGAVLPLAALVAVSRRAGRARRALALPGRPRRRVVAPAAAMILAAALLGLAAAQPVLARTTTLRVRTDAEVFVAIDISRSMLARQARGAPTRLDRSRRLAAELRDQLPGVPVGVASLTDRILPHLFPSPDDDVFRATLAKSLDIEQPPPRSTYAKNATSFDSLTDVASRRFFSPTAKRRVLVVLTDGESTPVTAARIGRVFRRSPAIKTVFIHVWAPTEHVYGPSGPEPQYHTDPSSGALLEALAVATGGAVFGEDQLDAAARKTRAFIGSGPTRAEGVRDTRNGLAPYLALVALLPLGLVLARDDR